MTYVERPRWVYNDGSAVDFTMSLPQRAWDFGKRQVGGSDVSAAGVPAAFVIRQDNLLYITLRFPVSEWDDVERRIPDEHVVYVSVTPTRMDRRSLVEACGEVEGQPGLTPASS